MTQTTAMAAYEASQALAMRESVLAEKVRRMCLQFGLLAYHTHNSKHSAPGYPDWHIVGPTTSIYRELKRQRENPTTTQKQWLKALGDIGYDVGVWRPSDLFAGDIARQLAALAHPQKARETR